MLIERARLRSIQLDKSSLRANSFFNAHKVVKIQGIIFKLLIFIVNLFYFSWGDCSVFWGMCVNLKVVC
jgi:hypothetical protein